MPDPLTAAAATTIATTIAAQATQAVTTQAGHVLAELGRKIRQKFSDRPADLAILTSAQNEPHIAERISLLAHALLQAAREDPEFTREILTLWTQSQAQAVTVTGDAAANVFNGNAEKVYQIGDVHNLTINLPRIGGSM